MGNIVIIIILAAIAALALRSGIKHFKGEGGCCGGCTACAKPKRLGAPKIGEKTVLIEGMHCEQCKAAVENELNGIDGAAARVSLKTNAATVAMSREVSDAELTAAVERAGFGVLEIRG